MILEAQMLRGRLHRATRWRAAALAEADNLMERVTAQPWNDLEPEKLAPFTLSDDFRSAVPNAALQLSVEPSAERPESRRISVEIAWPGPTGGAVRPVRLTSWVYRIEPADKPDAAPASPEVGSQPAAETEKKPDTEQKPAGEPAPEPKAGEQP